LRAERWYEEDFELGDNWIGNHMKLVDVELPRSLQFPFSAEDRAQPLWSRRERGGHWLVLIGVAICSIVPAAFWCGLIWLVGKSIGMPPSTATLLAVGSCIAAFLTIVTSVVLANT